MKSLCNRIIILLLGFLLVSISVRSQSEKNPLEVFMHEILVRDSIKVNIDNNISIFVSEDHELYRSDEEKDKVDIDSICSLIDNNSEFPLSIIISCKSSVKIKFYKHLVKHLKDCVRSFLDNKSYQNYATFFSKLEANQKQFIKNKYPIYIFDGDI